MGHGLKGVQKEVEEDLLQLTGVRPHAERLIVVVPFNPNGLALGFGFHQNQRVFDEVNDINRFGEEFARARQAEEAVDRSINAIHFLEQPADQFALGVPFRVVTEEVFGGLRISWATPAARWAAARRSAR